MHHPSSSIPSPDPLHPLHRLAVGHPLQPEVLDLQPRRFAADAIAAQRAAGVVAQQTAQTLALEPGGPGLARRMSWNVLKNIMLQYMTSLYVEHARCSICLLYEHLNFRILSTFLFKEHNLRQ